MSKYPTLTQFLEEASLSELEALKEKYTGLTESRPNLTFIDCMIQSTIDDMDKAIATRKSQILKVEQAYEPATIHITE